MSKERMLILEMVESGKITAAEAEVLFRALGDEEPGERGYANDAPGVEALHPPEPAFRGEMDRPSVPPPPRPEPARPAPAPAAPNRRRRYPDPSYAVAMKRTGMDFSIDQLFRMQEEDVEPEQAAWMVRVRRPEWTSEDIVEMLVQGACPELVNKLNELGFENLSPQDAIQLTEHDVEVDYLERFHKVSLNGLTASDLMEFYDNDVDPDLAAALGELGPISGGEIVKAAEAELSPASVRRTAQMLPGVTVWELIELSENDVSADFIKTLVRGGFTNLTVKQVIQLQENDIDPREAAWFREKLGESITPEGLVRLAYHDIGRDYVEPLLALHLPDLSVDTLIEMADHDVSAEDAALAREAYGEEITAADLIAMADE